MDKKAKECIRMLRDLVSDVQGAPFPGGDINTELYAIWYEHAQRAAPDDPGGSRRRFYAGNDAVCEL